MPTALYHFSDQDDIETFVPRSPVLRPDKEALVYAIDAWHSPLYFFPRNCPRIAIWPIATTSTEDRHYFSEISKGRIKLFIDKSQEPAWRNGSLTVYEFDPKCGFVHTGDIGVWVSEQTVAPMSTKKLADLPSCSTEASVDVVVVDNILETAKQFFDFDNCVFTTTLHVSMIRFSAMPDWPTEPAK